MRIPRLADRRPLPADPPQTRDDFWLGLHHAPERMLVPQLAGWPAHLHIDLLPDHQGKGHGRALMERLFESLRDAGVRGVHLGMVPTNVKARVFYERIGFRHIPVDGEDGVLYLAYDL